MRVLWLKKQRLRPKCINKECAMYVQVSGLARPQLDKSIQPQSAASRSIGVRPSRPLAHLSPSSRSKKSFVRYAHRVANVCQNLKAIQ